RLELTHEEIREAKDELWRLSRDSKERELYDMRENSLRDKMSALHTAEQKGMQKGMQKGIQEGMQKGIQKGIEQEKRALAQALLDILDDETIAVKTGLTKEDVYALRGSK
ncbi:MAG: hypothetical protein ACRCW2_01400, partial [Cellulosilyticaceae bacterium]